MEKWKVITAAAAVGVATVGGLVVSSSVVAADQTSVSSSAMARYAADMAVFCATPIAAANNTCTDPHRTR